MTDLEQSALIEHHDMTAPRTAADRLRNAKRTWLLPSEPWDRLIDDALAESAAPYREALERLTDGNPAIPGGWCFWCGGLTPAQHDADCRWVEARALLRREVGE
jgi:hypothetical protein